MKKLALVMMFMLIAQAACVAALIEITTGRGYNEGIKMDDGRWLPNGALIQVIRVKTSRQSPPMDDGSPSYPDELVATVECGYNFPFDKDRGKFDLSAWADSGDRFFVRAWDGNDRYGDSEIFSVSGVDGEMIDIGGGRNEPAFVVKIKIDKGKGQNE